MQAPMYLDYAAATPLDERVEAAMRPYWREQFYNPSALYLPARQVAADLKAARAAVARCLGARPSEIIFTAGGTEADNLAIHGVMQQHPEANVVVSAIEHEAILQAAAGYRHTTAPVTARGIVNLDKLKRLLNDQTVLVSIMYANNEVGTVQPLAKVASILQEVRAARKQAGNPLPLYFHTDASQAPNYLPLYANKLGVDMMTLNGGKIYGPKQSGALYVAAGTVLTPLVQGGGQEQGLRSGTENVPGIIGFATALDIAQSMRAQESKRLQHLRQQFIAGLEQAFPHLIVNGDRRARLPNNVHVTIPGVDNERVVMQLDEAGILCAAGSACTASSEEPSHVLKAMGLSDADAQASLRFTLGRPTTEQDLTRVVTALQKVG